MGEGKSGGEGSIHNHIGLGPQHTGESLEFRDDEIAKDIDVRRLDQNDDVVRTRCRIGSPHPLYLGSLLGDIPGRPCRTLDKDIR